MDTLHAPPFIHRVYHSLLIQVLFLSRQVRFIALSGVIPNRKARELLNNN